MPIYHRNTDGFHIIDPHISYTLLQNPNDLTPNFGGIPVRTTDFTTSENVNRTFESTTPVTVKIENWLKWL